MKKSGLFASIFICLIVLGLAATTDARAQETVPCCEGGAHPSKKCVADEECPSACAGGSRNGRACGELGCPNACVGGADDGRACDTGADCRTACVGGQRSGAACDVASGPGCPGGTCTDVGACSDVGTCVGGTCTAMCRVRSNRKAPANPTAAWLDLSLPLVSDEEALVIPESVASALVKPAVSRSGDAKQN